MKILFRIYPIHHYVGILVAEVKGVIYLLTFVKGSVFVVEIGTDIYMKLSFGVHDTSVSDLYRLKFKLKSAIILYRIVSNDR